MESGATDSEILRLTNALAEELPDWSSTEDPSISLNYGGLKVAAIKMASTPECAQRAVIMVYRQRYARNPPDLPKLSGMYLLMRVLFVLPSDYPSTGSIGTFAAWSLPVGREARQTKKWNYQWPVHVNPDGRTLEIERCQGTCRNSAGYAVIEEYDWLKSELRFPMRTPAEIESLEIRALP